MGLLGQFFGGDQRKQNSIIGSVMSMLGGQRGSGSGGISGVLDRFRSNGMSDEVSSWVGRGQNRPVTGRQVRSALGNDEIKRIAQDAGVSEDEASEGVARVLPQAVDELTPEGRLPEGDDSLQGRLNSLKERFLR